MMYEINKNYLKNQFPTFLKSVKLQCLLTINACDIVCIEITFDVWRAKWETKKSLKQNLTS